MNATIFQHTNGASRPTRRRGFTLIELMITVVIIGILAAIAMPSYNSYIRKGKRATAQAALMDIASREQTYLLDRRAYTDDLTALGFSAPTEIKDDYTFKFVAFDATLSPAAFTAKAEPSSKLKSLGELDLTVNNLGVKTPASTSGYWGK